MQAYPLLLSPACKDYLWGGNRLRLLYGKQSDADRIAETWELSCHPDGESRVTNGVLAGCTLSEALERLGRRALGERAARLSYFPLLIKLIDAKQDLSIQVHPDDAYAAVHENGSLGKTEMWYVVDAQPDSALICGFSRDVSREEVRRRIGERTLTDVLQRVPVRAGDVLFIEAGTIHAICGGVLIAEIQQNSNTTYRVYDYGRLDKDGRPRPLHVEKALDVLRFGPAAPPRHPETEPDGAGNGVAVLASCPLFRVERWELAGEKRLVEPDSFVSLLLLSGRAELTWADGAAVCPPGQSIFVPAGLRCALRGECELLATVVGG